MTKKEIRVYKARAKAQLLSELAAWSESIGGHMAVHHIHAAAHWSAIFSALDTLDKSE